MGDPRRGGGDPAQSRDKLIKQMELQIEALEAKKLQEILRGTNPLENPEQYVKETKDFYTSKGLPEWAPNENTAEQIEHMPQEYRELVEKYQKEGWIAMYMPSRTVQMETLAKAVIKLRPLWYTNNAIQGVTSTFLRLHVSDLIEEKHPDLFKDVPDQPYFDLTNPTQNVPENTTFKNLTEQKTEFARMKAVDPNLSLMGLPGYLAVQAWGTRIAFAKHVEDGDSIFEVSPLDSHHSGTRLIDMPVPEGEMWPPTCGFDTNSDYKNMQIGAQSSGGAGSEGFRVSVRVPIAAEKIDKES